MGGGGVPANQTVTQQVQLPGWASTWAQDNAQTAQSLAAQPYTPYPYQEVAPFAPAQTQAQTAVENLQGYTTPYFNTALNNVTNLPAATQSLLNPYLGSVEADTVSNINRSAALTGQQMDQQATNVGAFGGTRTGVEDAELASETQRNIGQAVNQIQSQGYNTAQAAALQQSGLLGTLATGSQNAQLEGIGALNTIGGEQQQQNQALYSNALQQWQESQNWPYQELAIAQGSLSGTPYGGTVTASQPYNSNPLASNLGLAAASIPLVNQLGSSLGFWGNAGSAAGGAGGSAAPGMLGAGASMLGTLGSGLYAAGDAAGTALGLWGTSAAALGAL